MAAMLRVRSRSRSPRARFGALRIAMVRMTAMWHTSHGVAHAGGLAPSMAGSARCLRGMHRANPLSPLQRGNSLHGIRALTPRGISASILQAFFLGLRSSSAVGGSGFSRDGPSGYPSHKGCIRASTDRLSFLRPRVRSGGSAAAGSRSSTVSTSRCSGSGPRFWVWALSDGSPRLQSARHPDWSHVWFRRLRLTVSLRRTLRLASSPLGR